MHFTHAFKCIWKWFFKRLAFQTCMENGFFTSLVWWIWATVSYPKTKLKLKFIIKNKTLGHPVLAILCSCYVLLLQRFFISYVSQVSKLSVLKNHFIDWSKFLLSHWPIRVWCGWNLFYGAIFNSDFLSKWSISNGDMVKQKIFIGQSFREVHQKLIAFYRMQICSLFA